MLGLFVSANQKLESMSNIIKQSNQLMQQILSFIQEVHVVSKFDLADTQNKTLM